MKFVRRLLFLVCLSGLLGVAASAQDLQEETLFLTFVPNVQFAPVYAAIEQGFFADEGLTITLQHGDEPDGVNLIAAGELNFGVISGEQVIQARAQERPVVMVYEWFQAYPVGVAFSPESGIETVADLQGRRVGIPGLFGASLSGIIALLSSADLTTDDIQLEPIGFNAPEVLCLGAFEAAVVYINNEPLQIQQRIDSGDCPALDNVAVLAVSDAVDMVSNGLVTSEAVINESPEMVQAVVNAFDLGLRAALNNPAEAYLMSAQYVENLLPEDLEAALVAESAAQEDLLSRIRGDRHAIAATREAMRERLHEQLDAATLVQFDVLLNTMLLWEADRLGETDAASWAATEEVLIAAGLLDAAIPLDAAYSNAFIRE
jgi:NitT/TauT family transport system substrate-binding protein